MEVLADARTNKVPLARSFAWSKVGNIINVDTPPAPWVHSHAQVPTVLVRDDSLRIYFSSRTHDIKSYPLYCDVDRRDPSKILYLNTKPFLQLGARGTFDDDGVMPCSVVEDNGVVYLYYIGWNRGVTVSYRNSIGVAVSEDGGNTFKRMFEGPIVDRTKEEPHMAASPFVMKERDTWHLWYTSGTKWIEIKGKTEPVYTIRHAISDDGINWNRDHQTCITPDHDLQAFARPTVVNLNGAYHMWYNFRESEDYRDGTGSYQMGYAVSQDGNIWQRRDEDVGIVKSENGWDSSMMCYAHVLHFDNKLHMFYNGNGFGSTGIGYAYAPLTT